MLAKANPRIVFFIPNNARASAVVAGGNAAPVEAFGLGRLVPEVAAMAKKKSASKKTSGSRRWSQRVTETSDALTLKERVFTLRSSKAVARSLKRSADHSSRRKSSPFRSAMSMLTFYLNRAGKNLPAQRKRVLEGAKDELRRLYGR